MTYNQARLRISVYFLLSWALLIGTISILFTAFAKGI
jgi:hypothetical protein